jgi:TRAP-type C4-dicarboxylate transport system substrate-binding protein
VEALGGQPVWFDPGEVYMGLKLGTIDGVFFGWAELETIKLKEVVDYVMMPSMINPVNFDWIVSMKSWNKLSPEMQSTYMKAFRDNMLPQHKRSMQVCRQGLEAAKAYGVEVITLSPEEQQKFKEASIKVWEKAAQKDKNSAEAIQMLKDYMKSKGLLQ